MNASESVRTLALICAAGTLPDKVVEVEEHFLLALHILHALLPDATSLHIDQFKFEILFPVGFGNSTGNVHWLDSGRL